jgi:hypothetical protein
MSTHNYKSLFNLRRVMVSFLSDWRPATSLSAMSSRPNGSAESEASVISTLHPDPAL